MLSQFFRVLIVTGLLLADAVQAQEQLRNLTDVHLLTPTAAAQKLPVTLEAVATFVELSNGGLFIHDGREGVYLQMPPAMQTNMVIRPGDRLAVIATTSEGNYLPDLECRQIKILGAGELPQPTVVNEKNIFSPGLDCQWVSVVGTIVSAEAGHKPQIALTLEVYGWTLKVLVTTQPDMEQKLARLMQQRVQFRGVAATVFNRQRQMTGRYFLVPSLDLFQLLDPQQNNSGVGQDVDHLLRADTGLDNPVQVRGVVTHAGENELFLRGEGGSLRVVAAQTSGFKVGDTVEAEGFANIAPFRPMLRARQVRLLKNVPSQILSPVELALNDLSGFPAELVSVTAEFLGQRVSPEGVILQCRADGKFFEASLPGQFPLPPDLTPNCRLRLTGICELTTTHPLPRSEWVDGFRLRVRSEKDMVITSHPAWWTAERLLVTLSVMAGLGMMSVIWIWQLRRQVLAQTKIIGTQIEKEAVMSERQRIARELHDTLEQELSGVAIQLRNAQQKIEATPKEASEAITLAQQMLRYSRNEARTSIRDLRSALLEQRGLAGAMEEILSPLIGAATTQFDLAVHGTRRKLDATMETHLLRITQESVGNAVNHAQAQQIHVTLEYLPREVRLVIQDDGRGFDATAPPPKGHFGLLGMQERVNKLGGRLSIQSYPDKGATVTVLIPDPDQPLNP